MKKRIIRTTIISVSITLSLVLTFCATVWGLHYFDKGVPEGEFLPYPDAVTVYYTDGEELKSEQLSELEIALVYAAFEELKTQFVGADCLFGFYHPWEEGYFFGARKAYGCVEFHYEQKRKFLTELNDVNKDLPEWDEEFDDPYSFAGSFDSVAITPQGRNRMALVGCRNGKYYGNYDDMKFSFAAYEAFWAVVNSYVA